MISLDKLRQELEDIKKEGRELGISITDMKWERKKAFIRRDFIMKRAKVLDQQIREMS